MAKIVGTTRHGSGIPLGGIGTGTVEIWDDGMFHDWQIFNMGRWSPASEECFFKRGVNKCGETDERDLLFSERIKVAEQAIKSEILAPQDLIFAIRVKEEGKEPVVRYLGHDPEIVEMHVASWRQCVEVIEYDGRFPVATLTYKDSSLPLQVQAEVFSSFLPSDEKNSGIPGFYMNFKLKNMAKKRVEASIMGILKNPASKMGSDELLRHYSYKDGDSVYIKLCSDNVMKDAPNYGDMTFAVTGGEIGNINICNWHGRRADRELWNDWGSALVSYFYDFRDKGNIFSSDRTSPVKNLYRSDLTGLSAEDKERLLEELLTDALIRNFYDRIREYSPAEVESKDFIDRFLHHALVVSPTRWPKVEERGWDSVLCSKVTLSPMGSEEILFTVSWYYPNHYSPNVGNMGHMYENWFADSLEVNRYLVENFVEFYNKTLSFRDSLYCSTIGEIAVEAIGSQLTTLFKSSWWLKDGLFGIWEGLGSCGFHTTDVSYYGTYPIITLFPDLQKTQMLQGAKYQNEAGRVHHTFLDDFFHVDIDSYERVDMNPQFVMMAYRDYVLTGDEEYIRRLWPYILKAMNNTALLDADGDGLPDKDCEKQTYDVWNLSGCPSYIGSLWLGALYCAIKVARLMGDEQKADEWSRIYEKGKDSFKKLLWNGEYYNLWVDPETGKKDESCMADQISGEGFLRINGIGSFLDDNHVKELLATIFKYNYSVEDGLMNARVFKDRQCSIHTYKSFHAIVPWSGVEYLMAGFMIQNGLVGEAYEIIENIHKRYFYSGKFWRHMECGENYYRALSSWSIMVAFAGFKWDGVSKSITFNPFVSPKDFNILFAVPGVWGTYKQKNTRREKYISLYITSGKLELSQIELPSFWGTEIKLSCNGITLKADITEAGGMVRLVLPEKLALPAGAEVIIEREQYNT